MQQSLPISQARYGPTQFISNYSEPMRRKTHRRDIFRVEYYNSNKSLMHASQESSFESNKIVNLDTLEKLM